MDALACVRREIRRLQEQQRRARCVQARLGLTRTERLVAVGCYTQSNYNLPLAITFVKQRAPTSWLPSTDTELGEVLENWFLERLRPPLWRSSIQKPVRRSCCAHVWKRFWQSAQLSISSKRAISRVATPQARVKSHHSLSRPCEDARS